MEKRLNVVKIGDQFGWAYFFLDREQSLYSCHNITYSRYNEADLTDVDIIYIHSPDINPFVVKNLPQLAKSRGIKVIGGYGGHMDIKYSDIDLVVTIDPETLHLAKEMYSGSGIPVIFLPESMDTNFFVPKERKSKQAGDFNVGWAGRPTWPVKRCHMLDKLNFNIIRKQDWGPKYFQKDRTLDDMRNFYHSLDAFVLPSASECMPRVVLESMAAGLPVVATSVGCIPMLLEPEWIVPVYPEADAIHAINEKLQLLKENPELRRGVGERNRLWVENKFSWKVNQPTWDDVFSALHSSDYDRLNQLGGRINETN